MNEHNRNPQYNPKYSSDSVPWDQSHWQTGSTQPPKNRGGLIALLLILIIFLVGIITVLGILNIRLFQRLNTQENAELSISFSSEAEAIVESPAQAQSPESDTSDVNKVQTTIDLQQTPQSVDNVPLEGGLSLQEIYRKNIPAVVSISCTLPGGSSTGTGVILSEDGYIVTNSHVVENAVSINVQLTDGRTFAARLVGADDITDLAVLHIDAEGLTPAQFGDSSSLQVGDTVAAIGDPLGAEFRGTMTDGIVSAINRDVAVDGRTMTLIQTNAALNSGNSGGPLINCYGQVIGINTMKIGTFATASGVEGLGFAIPSTTVKDVVDQLVNQGYVSGRPTLGIAGETLSPFYQHYYRMPAGLYITEVAPGSDAAASGIESGDILVGIDGTPITDMDTLNAVLFRHEVGDTVAVTVYRSGYQATVELTLSEDKG